MEKAESRKGYRFGSLSGRVIEACIAVQRQLGVHCMEVDYQRALEIELQKRALCSQREVDVPIEYDGAVVTIRRVDFVIWDAEEQLILEIKARKEILLEDLEQCLLYLKKGGYKLCLLVNFGQMPLGIKRLVN